MFVVSIVPAEWITTMPLILTPFVSASASRSVRLTTTTAVTSVLSTVQDQRTSSVPAILVPFVSASAGIFL